MKSTAWLLGAGVMFLGASGLAGELPSAVSGFKQSAKELSAQDHHPSHPQTVRVMREMAKALRAIPAVPRERADDIDTEAQNIERSKPTARTHEDSAKLALQSAVAGLSELPRCGALDAELTRSRSAIRRIDEGRAFLKQKPTIDDAFACVADAIEAGASCQARVAETRAIGHQRGGELQPVAGLDEPQGVRKTVKINRGAFFAVGHRLNVERECAGKGLAAWRIHPTAGDVAYHIFSAGWYTPMHVDIICNP